MMNLKQYRQSTHLWCWFAIYAHRIECRAYFAQGFTKTLGDIVQYMEQLQKLDVDNIKPTSHAVPVGNVFRSDVVKPSLTNSQALAIAVEAKDGSFKVPLVIE